MWMKRGTSAASAAFTMLAVATEWSRSKVTPRPGRSRMIPTRWISASHPSIEASRPFGVSTSPGTRSIPSNPLRSASEPGRTRQRTVKPWAWSAWITALPTKPVPPVTKTRCMGGQNVGAGAESVKLSWSHGAARDGRESRPLPGRGGARAGARAGSPRRGRGRAGRGERRRSSGGRRPRGPGRARPLPESLRRAEPRPPPGAHDRGHDLRRGVAHQGCGDHAGGSPPGRAGEALSGRPAREISEGVLRPRVPGSHDPPDSHPYRGIPRFSVPRRDAGGISPGGGAPGEGGAPVPARRVVQLQRHGLHRPRRARAPDQRGAPGPLRRETSLPAPRHAGDDLPSGPRDAPARRADGGAEQRDAPRRRPRRERSAPGRHLRPRRALLDGGRPRALRPDALERGEGPRGAGPQGGDDQSDVEPDRGGRHRPDAGLGRGVALFPPDGSLLSPRLGRPHGVHRHHALDRPPAPDVPDPPPESRSPVRQGQGHQPPVAGDCRSGGRPRRPRRSPPPPPPPSPPLPPPPRPAPPPPPPPSSPPPAAAPLPRLRAAGRLSPRSGPAT